MTKMNLKVCYTGEFLNVKQIAFDLLKNRRYFTSSVEESG